MTGCWTGSYRRMYFLCFIDNVQSPEMLFVRDGISISDYKKQWKV